MNATVVDHAVEAPSDLRSNGGGAKRVLDGTFRVLLYAALGIALGALAMLLWRTYDEGSGALSLDLLTKPPSERPAKAGEQHIG